MYQVVEESQDRQEYGPRLKKSARPMPRREEEAQECLAMGDDGDDLRIMQHFVTNLIESSNEE